MTSLNQLEFFISPKYSYAMLKIMTLNSRYPFSSNKLNFHVAMDLSTFLRLYTMDVPSSNPVDSHVEWFNSFITGSYYIRFANIGSTFCFSHVQTKNETSNCLNCCCPSETILSCYNFYWLNWIIDPLILSQHGRKKISLQVAIWVKGFFPQIFK